jgi:hypothetical protein
VIKRILPHYANRIRRSQQAFRLGAATAENLLFAKD